MDAGTQTVNSDLKVKIQTHTETQTDEFEYSFKETFVQPFTEEYFVNNEDRVQFYTRLPGFDVLTTTFRFVSPLVCRKSKTCKDCYKKTAIYFRGNEERTVLRKSE